MTSDLIERIIQRAIDIQQIPAPTFQEEKRAKYIRQEFKVEGLVDISMDEICNVYGRLPGESSDTCLVVSAHTDTVFSGDTDLTITKKPGQIIGPGIGDNSMGVAGLFGLVWALREEGITLPGDLWLVANVGEEGLGDLKGIRRVVDRFEEKPLGYIVLEGMVFERVYHRGLGSRRYRITARTAGGHSWVDHGTPSAIHEMASFITALTSLKLSKQPRMTLNVGTIEGGLSVNSIASEATIELDLRSEDGGQLNKLTQKIEKLVQKSNKTGVEFTSEIIGDREMGEIAGDHPLVQLAVEVLEKQGRKAELSMGSTDANVPLSRGYPAICIGLTHGGGAHTEKEFILTDGLSDGLAQLVEVVQGAFEVL